MASTAKCSNKCSVCIKMGNVPKKHLPVKPVPTPPPKPQPKPESAWDE